MYEFSNLETIIEERKNVTFLLFKALLVYVQTYLINRLTYTRFVFYSVY
jgi:hypothetical protein